MATTPQAVSKSPTIRRILREAAEISNAPSPDYTAEPLESDLFEWHFTLRGPPGSPYDGGIYHGRIVLPPTYPLRPPSFRFMTPNGRFEANREICLSISGHHEETWQPAWGIRTAVVALRTFMTTNAAGQLGGLDTTESVRRRLATESPAFRCAVCNRTNADIVRECEERAREAGASASDDVVVPGELNMGFRDEMEAAAAKKEKEKEAEEERAGEDTTAELAEGFVQTVPVHAPVAAVTSPESTAAAPNTVRSRPQPERSGAPITTSPPPQQQHMARRATDDGIPVWMDRLIVVLVVLLAALVLKVLFAI